jgi:tRNA 2-selenouridine synthase SelU
MGILVPLFEFFTVLHVFLPESAGIWSIPGILQNQILAVLLAKIVISVPRNSGGFRNGPGITRTESTGTESTECFLIVIVNFKCNTNYLILITVN